jgi:uncharacterized protein YjbI with pentapeptide repeats
LVIADIKDTEMIFVNFKKKLTIITAAAFLNIVSACEMVPYAFCTGQNLRNATFYGVDMHGAEFGVIFSERHTQPADLTESDLSGSDFSEGRFYRTILEKANLQATIARKANFTEANLRGADLRGADLSGAIFHKANLHGADLRWAKLDGANLTKAHLEDARLENASLKNTIFSKAFLRNAILINVNAENSHFNEADLRGAWLIGGFFNNSSFVEADLTQACFELTAIPGVDFRRAKLQFLFNYKEADFRETELSDAVWVNGEICAKGSIGRCRKRHHFFKY